MARRAGGGFLPWSVQRIVKTATTTIAAAVGLADVPRDAAGSPLMRLLLLAGRRYRVRAEVLTDTDTAGNGIALALTVPAFSVFGGLADMPVIALANPATNSAVTHGPINASADLVVASSRPNNGTAFDRIHALIIPSATGYVTLQMAAEAAVGNVSVKLGTVLIAEDIGP